MAVAAVTVRAAVSLPISSTSEVDNHTPSSFYSIWTSRSIATLPTSKTDSWEANRRSEEVQQPGEEATHLCEKG